jgi:hypothetical protein
MNQLQYYHRSGRPSIHRHLFPQDLQLAEAVADSNIAVSCFLAQFSVREITWCSQTSTREKKLANQVLPFGQASEGLPRSIRLWVMYIVGTQVESD